MSLKAGHEAVTNLEAASPLYRQTTARSNIPVDFLKWIVDRRPRNVFLRSSRHYEYTPSPYGYHRREFQHHGTGLDVSNCSCVPSKVKKKQRMCTQRHGSKITN